MNGIATFLSDRVESVLPRSVVAACLPASPWCSTTSEQKGDCTAYFHKNCHLSCHGKAVCGPLSVAACDGLVEKCG